MKKILTIFGTRPETIKLALLCKALKKKFGNNAKTCLTGQHQSLAEPFLKIFKLKPDFNLHLMEYNQTPNDIFAYTQKALQKILSKFKPDLVIIQGDTTTACASAITAFHEKIPVLHVEAGLRSHDKYAPWPEEMNRRLIACVADIHCAPSKISAKNLLQEGINKKTIFVTGNTFVDSFLYICDYLEHHRKLQISLKTKFDFLDSSKPLILVTSHRRESFGKPLQQICTALKTLAKQQNCEIIYPVHLNPNVKQTVRKILNLTKNVHLIEPLNYLEFIYLMQKAYLILTDSGGVQEEASILGKPTLILRDVTDRPETIQAGVAKLTGRNTKKIIKKVKYLLNNKTQYNKMKKKRYLYGKGDSVAKIMKILNAYLLFLG